MNGDVVSAPAGWFPDPENPGQLRYFDGTQWTEHRAPLPAPPVEATAPEQPAQAPTYTAPAGHAAPTTSSSSNKVIGIIVVGAIILLVGGIGLAASLTSGDDDPAANPIPQASGTSTDDTTEESPTPEPDPEPDGTYTSTCDLLLFAGPNDQSYLVGTARVKNTGEVDAELLVKGSWVQVGSKPIVRTKTVTVTPGARKAINFKVPISLGQIDAYQSGYDLKRECKVTATITN